jgi:hypothetical protein
MDAQAQMPMRLMAIFRVLSVLTLLEGLAGVVLTIVRLPMDWMMLQKMANPVPHSTLLIYLIALVNLAFAVTLVVAGTLLWMLRRRGLFLVSWTLVAEIAYFFILDTGMTMYVHHKMGGGEFFENFSYITLGGNVVLAVQLVTGFPVIAAVLIFFAYRYLGIPARPLPENVGERT